MKKEIPRKKITRKDGKKKAAQDGGTLPSGGLHFGDYRPRYKEPFDIYEKAKSHIRKQKQNKEKGL